MGKPCRSVQYQDHHYVRPIASLLTTHSACSMPRATIGCATLAGVHADLCVPLAASNESKGAYV
jgi:hypothetical protein